MGAEMEGHLMYVFVILILRKERILKYLFFIFCSWRESWNVPIFSPEWGGTWSKKKKTFIFILRKCYPAILLTKFHGGFFYVLFLKFELNISNRYYLGTYVFVVVIFCLLLIPYNTSFLLTTFVIKNLEFKP